MPSDPMNDPRNIWQNQPTEPFHMSTDEIRHKAQQRYTEARMRALLSIAMGLGLCALFAWASARAHETVTRMGWGLVSLWCIWFAYHAYRWMWPDRLAPDATVSTSLEFYQRELDRRRDYALHVWGRSGLPFCFLGLAMVVLPPLIQAPAAQRLNALPFFVLLVIWIAAFIVLRKRDRRKLQQEIDELQAFEREHRP